MRNLAVGLTLLVLVYVGIRMSISTVADEKAKYQKMLIAWVKGFCLIFVLIYIVTFAINISNALVDTKYFTGLNEFKLSFGSVAYEYLGDLELITNKRGYNMYRSCVPIKNLIKSKLIRQ